MNENAPCRLQVKKDLGEFDPKITHRLALLFRGSPPAAWEKLYQACEFLGITGNDLGVWLELAENKAAKEAA